MRSHVNSFFYFLILNTLSHHPDLARPYCQSPSQIGTFLITNIVNKATYLSSDVLSKDQSYLLTTNTT